MPREALKVFKPIVLIFLVPLTSNVRFLNRNHPCSSQVKAEKEGIRRKAMLLLNDPRNFRMFAPDSGTNEGDDWTDELQQELDEFEGDLQDAFENGSPVGVSSEPGAAVHIQEDGKFFEYEIGPEVFLY